MKYFTEADGLAQNYIYSIFQDRRGFLWLATAEGLCRFDGNDFKTYTVEDGLFENFVTSSVVTENGTIWLGHHEGGLTQYDLSGKFTPIELEDIELSSVVDMEDWGQGYIWVASQRDGLVLLNPDSTAKQFKDDLKRVLINQILLQDSAHLLLGTNEGLIRFALNREERTAVLDDYVSIIPSTKVTSMCRGKNGEFWIATEDEGLFKYYPATADQKEKIIHYGENEGIAGDRVDQVFMGDEGNLWIASNGKGFKKFYHDAETGKITPVPPLSPDSKLDQEFIRCFFQDSEGQFWFGTYGNGLIYIKDEIFTLYQPDNEKLSRNVISLLQDTDGNYWVGTDRGLYMTTPENLLSNFIFYSASSGLPTQFPRSFSRQDGLPGDRITTLYQGADGKIWIGTEENGIAKLDPSSGKITPMKFSDQDLANSVNNIYQDRTGMVWVATKDGAYRLDPETGAARSFTTKDGLPHNNIYDIFQARDMGIWIATESQRIPILQQNNEFIYEKPDDSASVISYINSFTEDEDGNIWVATQGDGIYQYKDGKFTIYDTRHGLLSNYCYVVTVDRANNIWVGHRTGLSKLVQSTGKILVYDKNYGFPEGEINLNSSIRDQKGNLWFGTPNGLIRYNPIKDKSSRKEPNTFITDFYIDGQRMELKEGIKLPYQKYAFKFEFLGLNFKDQDQVKYTYKLEGNDVEWSELSSKNDAGYQGLAGGNYTFMVKACNKEGVCNQVPVTFSFSINPPFWETWWFVALCVLAFVLVAYGIMRYRLLRLNREKMVLEGKVNERTAELKVEKDKVQELNRDLEKLVEKRTQQLFEANEKLSEEYEKVKETSQKLSTTNKELDNFIYRASHDLKQPLASVLGLVNVAKLEVEENSAIRYFDLIGRSVSKLDRIVIGLIEVRQLNQTMLKHQDINLHGMVESTAWQVQGELPDRKTELEMNVPENIRITSDSYLLGLVFRNLIENSILFSDPKKEQSWLKILAQESPDQVIITLADNGTGIKAEIMDRLYDMFFKGVPDASRSGLGLYVVKNALEKIGGKISIESREGEGTTVTVTLPRVATYEAGE
ncbi:MAG: hypothetical protein H6581_15140 [Bacteroidia bacterium]|nr:hypothetical protein [Bacteroidia bacterium]